MNKKKNILILAVSAIIVTLLIFLGIRLVKGAGSSVESELINFAIKDTESIDKIKITDEFGRVFEVVKQASGEWTDKDGNCITQDGVHYILDACKKIEFKGYLTDAAVESNRDMMLSKHLRVDYSINGKWNKTWYIGSATQDHLGQVMLLESAEEGLSDRPVIMAIKGVHGIIDPRFYADPLKWQCTRIFSYEAKDIKKVNVEYPLESPRSFSVENRGGVTYDVKQQGFLLRDVDTQFTMIYLNKFRKIHYEVPNYLLNINQIDSLKRTSPFCKLTIEDKNGKVEQLRMFRIKAPSSTVNEFGVGVDYDIERFWAELPSGEIVKCQYFVFDPLILGHLYFPLDLKGVNVGDYTIKSPDQYQDTRRNR